MIALSLVIAKARPGMNCGTYHGTRRGAKVKMRVCGQWCPYSHKRTYCCRHGAKSNSNSLSGC